jgi:hypothetical protein
MGYLRHRQTAALGAFDLQQLTRQFPRTVPLGSVATVVARALAVASSAAAQTVTLPADTAQMARTNLDRVMRGLENVANRATALVRAGTPTQSGTPPDVMGELRKWSLQAFIESNAIGAANDTMAEAQRAFWSDLAEEAKKVATAIVQAPANLVSTALSPLTNTVLIVGLAIGVGFLIMRRRRES